MGRRMWSGRGPMLTLLLGADRLLDGFSLLEDKRRDIE